MTVEFRKQNRIADQSLKEETERIEQSLVKPTPIDFKKRGMSRSQFISLKFKNTVIIVMNKLR